MMNEAGVSLMVLGVGVSLIGYIMLSSQPLLILGISIFTIGLLVFWGGDLCEGQLREFAEVPWDNVAALIESLGYAKAAIYIPSAYAEDSKAYALLTPAQVKGPIRVPRGLVVRFGPNPEDVGILLRAPGTRAVELCRDAGALVGDLQVSLHNCIVNHLALARNILSAIDGNNVIVRVGGVRVSDMYGDTVARPVLGSFMASIVAAITADVLSRPVAIASEEVSGHWRTIRLTILGG